jgi:hypothetical protein
MATGQKVEAVCCALFVQASCERARQFFTMLKALAKNCHALRARTFEIFCSLRGYGQTHFTKSTYTSGRLLMSCGRARQPAFAFFLRAFSPRAFPRTPTHALGARSVAPKIVVSCSVVVRPVIS